MEKKQPDVLLNVVVIILACAFLFNFRLLVACLVLAVAYLAYEAYKK